MQLRWRHIGYFALFLLVCHAIVIYNDVKVVVEDPNMDNKPGEILKLVVDVDRYFPA